MVPFIKLAALASLATSAMGAEFRFGFQRDLMEASNANVTAQVGTASLSAAGINSWYANAAALKAFHNSVLARVPNKFTLRMRSYDRLYGLIYDGGSDMYDGGNRMKTSLCSNSRIASWQDNFALARMNRYNNNCFGTRGARSARFNLESTSTMIASVNTAGVPFNFEVTGNNGADNGGTMQSQIYRQDGVVVFRKSICNAGSDPSINHYIVTVDTGRQEQVFSGRNTDTDAHKVTNIMPGMPWYFMMVAGRQRYCYPGSVHNTVVQLLFDNAGLWKSNNGAPLEPGNEVAASTAFNPGYTAGSLMIPANQQVVLAGLPALGSAFTVCAYAHLRSNEGTVFDFQTAGGDAVKLVVDRRRMKVYTRNGNSFNSQQNILPSNIAASGFAQYCVSKSGNTARLYVNGVAKGAGNLPAPAGGARSKSSLGFGLDVTFGDVYVNTNVGLNAAAILNMNCNGDGTFAGGVCTCAASAGARCQYTDSVTCSGHGSATATGTCVCEASHFSASHTADPGAVFCDICAPGFQGEDCEHSNRFTCNNNGIAQPDGSCSCMAGFLGDECQHHDDHSCEGHGTVAADGSCTCDNGYAGDNCECDGSCASCLGPGMMHCTACPGNNQLASPFISGVLPRQATGVTFGVCVEPCGAEQYTMESGMCADWSPPCGVGFIEISPPSSTADRVCAPSCQPCTGDTYQSEPCTAGATVCTVCTPCTDTEYIAEACTATTDRVCLAKNVLVAGLNADRETATMTSVGGSLVLAPSVNGAGIYVGEADELGEKLVDLQAQLDESHRKIAELIA